MLEYEEEKVETRRRVVKVFNVEIDTNSDEMRKLDEGEWLNDNIINIAIQSALRGIPSEKTKKETVLTSTFFFMTLE